MSAVERELEAIIRREAEDVRPPEGAKARGWERLVAALPTDPGDEGGPGDGGEGGPGDGGEGGPGDGGGGGGSALPAGPVPLLKAAPVLKVVSLAVLLAVGAVVWSEVGGGPPVVAGDLPRELEPAPALHFGTRIHIPFAPEPGAGPSLVAPEPGVPATARPAPARPAPRPRAEGPEDNFAGELSLLAAGQAAIQRGELRKGLALLRSHKQRFPHGHFAQERDALIAIGRCEGGQAGAPEAGQKFLQVNGESIHADAVRSACRLGTNEE